MADNRWTEKAQNALRLAYEAASGLGHNYVGSEHILLLSLIHILPGRRDQRGIITRTERPFYRSFCETAFIHMGPAAKPAYLCYIL